MPWKPHPCPKPGCTNMVVRGDALHCRKHAIKTPEHVAKVTAAITGQKRTPEQRLALSLARRGPGLMVRSCGFCHAEFAAAKPSSKVRFCSRACGYAQRQGDKAKGYRHDMPIIECKVCGQSVRQRASTVQRITCSRRCNGIWRKLHQKNTGTNIERAVEAGLVSRGWPFVPQHTLCAVTIADFYLPEHRIAIFCDGDYWHSLPGKRARDARQTATLEAAGYLVHRFTGSAILANVDACLSQIKHG